MMNDKQLLQMLEVLGKNSRRSFAASDSVNLTDRTRDDQEVAATIRKIIGIRLNSSDNNNRRSFAASDTAAIPNPNLNRNVKGNRTRVLTDFIFRNGLR